MTKPIETSPVHFPEHQTAKDDEYYRRLNEYYDLSPGTNLDKLRAFTKYVPVAELGRFLAKNAIFQQIVGVQGSIVECGVFNGGGVMAWATLSAIYEPLNHLRRVIGFDTFAGFTSISQQDDTQGINAHTVAGGLAARSEQDLAECVRIFDVYRPLGHIPKVELVKGDAVHSMAGYLERNAHLVVALLYLDFDLYDPTRRALEVFIPRMPKGAIIAFDQLNERHWPGETCALVETVGVRSLRLQRFPFQPQISYAVLD